MSDKSRDMNSEPAEFDMLMLESSTIISPISPIGRLTGIAAKSSKMRQYSQGNLYPIWLYFPAPQRCRSSVNSVSRLETARGMLLNAH